MEPDDDALVQQAQEGDADAFRKLVERHSARVFRLSWRITGDEASAEDAVQETFFRAYRSLHRFDARARFGTWLHRIAVNTAIEIMRKSRRTPLEAPLGGHQEPEPLPSPEPGPERDALSQEVQRSVRTALAELSPMERTAFVLRHFEGRPIAEICRQLGLRESAGKQAIFRAVRKLRRTLEPLVQRSAVRSSS
ncbi:MAG TPA: RNA polymerase sigma factor [Thermoanaerobaculia bacterium]|nr:RNA polymerase sigma factor [Thermoanaerobaculia bacterium]